MSLNLHVVMQACFNCHNKKEKKKYIGQVQSLLERKGTMLRYNKESVDLKVVVAICQNNIEASQ